MASLPWHLEQGAHAAWALWGAAAGNCTRWLYTAAAFTPVKLPQHSSCAGRSAAAVAVWCSQLSYSDDCCLFSCLCRPSHALYFASYEAAKQLFGGNQEGHHPLATAAAGATATIVNDGCMNPWDVVKQRMQVRVAGSTGAADSCRAGGRRD